MLHLLFCRHPLYFVILIFCDLFWDILNHWKFHCILCFFKLIPGNIYCFLSPFCFLKSSSIFTYLFDPALALLSSVLLTSVGTTSNCTFFPLITSSNVAIFLKMSQNVFLLHYTSTFLSYLNFVWEVVKGEFSTWFLRLSSKTFLNSKLERHVDCSLIRVTLYM